MTGPEPRGDPDRDDDDDGGGRGGDLGILTFALVVTAIAILGIVVGIETSTGKGPPPGTRTCQTKCFAFWKLECPGDRFVSACFGFWTCEGATGKEIHACGTDP